MNGYSETGLAVKQIIREEILALRGHDEHKQCGDHSARLMSQAAAVCPEGIGVDISDAVLYQRPRR